MIETVSSATWTVAVIVLLFWLPGIGWGALLAPGRVGWLGAAARVAGAGLLVSLATMAALAVLGLAEPVPIVVATLAVSIVPFAVPRVRNETMAPRSWAARIRRVGGLALASCGLVAVAIVIPSHAQLGSSELPFSTPVWYYATLAEAIESSGGVPDTISEWGGDRPFQDDYLPASAHAAAAAILLPGDLPSWVEWYRLAILVSFAVVCAGLLSRWFPSWLAVAGTVLLAASVRFESKFLAYRPETVALILVLFVIWLADRALAERRPRLVVAAGVASAGVFLVHAEMFLLLGPAIVGLLAGRWLMGGDGRWRRPDRQRIGRGALVGGSILAGGLLLGAVANFAVTGHFRILGYAVQERSSAPSAAPADELPSGWRFSDDPTWDFYIAGARFGLKGSRPPGELSFPAALKSLTPASTLGSWPGLGDPTDLITIVGVAALTLSPLLGWRMLDGRRRRALITWAVFGAGLIAGSLLFVLLYDTFVPMRVGPRRLLPYVAILPVIALTMDLYIAARLLAGRRTPDSVRRAAGPIGVVLAFGVAIALASGSVVDDGSVDIGRVSDDAGQSLTAIRDELPPGARVLANLYTEGALGNILERPVLTDGRAVYLEDRAFLGETTDLLLGARVAFAKPLTPGAVHFLERNGVDYLLVAMTDVDGTGLGGYRPFEADLTALCGGMGYELVGRYGAERDLLLFRVDPELGSIELPPDEPGPRDPVDPQDRDCPP